MRTDSCGAYQESQILTASREQLLLITYDGILKFLAQARRGLQQANYEEKHIGIVRSATLVMELYRTLNFSATPSLAHNLARTYSYLIQELTRADATDDITAIELLMHLVLELRAAWAEAAQQSSAGIGARE